MTTKIAVSLPDEQVAAARRAVAEGRAPSVSAYVASARPARLSRFLGLAQVTVVSLDEPAARAAGVLCGRSGTDDVIDASVVVCARVHGHAVVTNDVGNLGRLDPTLRLIRP